MSNAARTAAACRIARLDRQKFNDLMASGEYPCAPPTTAGVPRVFEMPDLIGLFLYARLVERGRTVRQASTIVCMIVAKLHAEVGQGSPLPSFVQIAYDFQGNSWIAAGGPDVANPFASKLTAFPVLLAEVWNIGNLAAEVQRGLAEEGRILGGDE